MKSTHLIPIALTTVLTSGAAFAATLAPRPDHAVEISDVETVCTGGSANVRAEPRWKDYSTRLEFASRKGVYLGDETVAIEGAGKSIEVRCAGPWLLMDLPKGSYDLHAFVDGWSGRALTFNAPGRIVVHFKRVGTSKSA